LTSKSTSTNFAEAVRERPPLQLPYRNCWIRSTKTDRRRIRRRVHFATHKKAITVPIQCGQ